MDISKERLMAMLGGAKQVMDKVEGGQYKVDHTTVNEQMNKGGGQLLESLPEGAVPQTNAIRPMGNNYANLEKSKMPEHIKKLMVENPIPKLQMGSGGGPTFSLDDVSDLVKSSPIQNTQQKQYVTQQTAEATIVNSQGKMLITLTEAELDKKIQDALLQFMATTFTKSLTENTIKKTITTLIKEGKIKVKPKTTN